MPENNSFIGKIGGKMTSLQEYIEEWKKLGYTDKQSEELARLSKLGSAGEIEAHVADRMLNKTLKEYERECINVEK